MIKNLPIKGLTKTVENGIKDPDVFCVYCLQPKLPNIKFIIIILPEIANIYFYFQNALHVLFP